MITNLCNIHVYTSYGQTEQPYTVRRVEAISVVDGLLTIESDTTEGGRRSSAIVRFGPGEWARFTASSYNASA